MTLVYISCTTTTPLSIIIWSSRAPANLRLILLKRPCFIYCRCYVSGVAYASLTVHILSQIRAPVTPDCFNSIHVLLCDAVSDHKVHTGDDTVVHDDHALRYIALFSAFKQRYCILIQLLQVISTTVKIRIKDNMLIMLDQYQTGCGIYTRWPLY